MAAFTQVYQQSSIVVILRTKPPCSTRDGPLASCGVFDPRSVIFVSTAGSLVAGGGAGVVLMTALLKVVWTLIFRGVRLPGRSASSRPEVSSIILTT